jgi:hypothetical protein
MILATKKPVYSIQLPKLPTIQPTHASDVNNQSTHNNDETTNESPVSNKDDINSSELSVNRVFSKYNFNFKHLIYSPTDTEFPVTTARINEKELNKNQNTNNNTNEGTSETNDIKTDENSPQINVIVNANEHRTNKCCACVIF